MKFDKTVMGNYNVLSDTEQYMGFISTERLVFCPSVNSLELPLFEMVKITNLMKSLLKEEMDTSFPA